MYEDLARIHRGRERLRAIRGVYWRPDDPRDKVILEAVILDFSYTQIAIKIEDDDSLSLITCSSLKVDTSCEIKSGLGVSALEEPIGLPLLWSWRLTNHHGYEDGFQFEFAENVESDSTVLQFLGIGGEVKLRVLDSDFSETPG